MHRSLWICAAFYRLVRDGHTDQYIRFLNSGMATVLYEPPFSGRTAFIAYSHRLAVAGYGHSICVAESRSTPADGGSERGGDKRLDELLGNDD